MKSLNVYQHLPHQGDISISMDVCSSLALVSLFSPFPIITLPPNPQNKIENITTYLYVKSMMLNEMAVVCPGRWMSATCRQPYIWRVQNAICIATSYQVIEPISSSSSYQEKFERHMWFSSFDVLFPTTPLPHPPSTSAPHPLISIEHEKTIRTHHWNLSNQISTPSKIQFAISVESRKEKG